MGAVYKWDIEVMLQKMHQMKQEYENLTLERDFFLKLEEEVQRDWQSAAGDIYRQNLTVDMDNYNAVLKGLSEKINTLDGLIHNAYQQCEETVDYRIKSLCKSIRAL